MFKSHRLRCDTSLLKAFRSRNCFLVNRSRKWLDMLWNSPVSCPKQRWNVTFKLPCETISEIDCLLVVSQLYTHVYSLLSICADLIFWQFPLCTRCKKLADPNCTLVGRQSRTHLIRYTLHYSTVHNLPSTSLNEQPYTNSWFVCNPVTPPFLLAVSHHRIDRHLNSISGRAVRSNPTSTNYLNTSVPQSLFTSLLMTLATGLTWTVYASNRRSDDFYDTLIIMPMVSIIMCDHRSAVARSKWYR